MIIYTYLAINFTLLIFFTISQASSIVIDIFKLRKPNLTDITLLKNID